MIDIQLIYACLHELFFILFWSSNMSHSRIGADSSLGL